MNGEQFWTSTHIEIIATILMPLGSGILYLIWNSAQTNLKVNTMWAWFTNHGSDLTGYRPGDEKRRSGRNES